MVPLVFNWLPEVILDYRLHELLEAPVDAIVFELWSVQNVLWKIKFNHTVTGCKLRETENWKLTGRPWANTRANETKVCKLLVIWLVSRFDWFFHLVYRNYIVEKQPVVNWGILECLLWCVRSTGLNLLKRTSRINRPNFPSLHQFWD